MSDMRQRIYRSCCWYNYVV